MFVFLHVSHQLVPWLHLSCSRYQPSDLNIFYQDSLELPTIISNLFYKIIMINLMMHINIPQRENRGDILKKRLLLKCTQYMKMDDQRDLGVKAFSLNIENHKSI